MLKDRGMSASFIWLQKGISAAFVNTVMNIQRRQRITCVVEEL
jgi:hypothetical protein